MTFKAQLDKFKVNTLDKLIRVKRMSAFDLFSAIILQTPVDKGFLRNGWFVGMTGWPEELATTADKSGQEAITRLTKELEGTAIGKTVYFANRTPYAARIEFDGHSAQAPAGMVRVNVARWQDIVLNNARKVK